MADYGTVLITGANRGIGLELVRQYAGDGWQVVATCRRPGEAADLERLTAEVHGLDVTNGAEVDSLAGELAGTAIDILINNAGVYGPKEGAPGEVDHEAWTRVFRTNTMAPLKVSAAFVPHVAASGQGKIVTITSKMGSIADNSSGGAYVYRASKAAVNIVMKSLANDLRERGIAVAVVHPGWVKTEMSGPNALITATESVSGLRRVIAGLTLAQGGTFLNYDGRQIPW